MSKEEKQKLLGVWAEAVQDGANEFLELALDMKEGGKDGYEWPYLFGLYVDQLAKRIRSGNCVPDMTKAQRTHMAVAVSATHDAYTKHRNAVDVELFDKAEQMFVVFTELLEVCPVKLPEIKRVKKESRGQQLELPMGADVVVVLPKDTPQKKVDRITRKVNDMLSENGGGSFRVTVGETEAAQVRVRAGNEEKYSAVIDEVLRKRAYVPEKTIPTEETPQQF